MIILPQPDTSSQMPRLLNHDNIIDVEFEVVCQSLLESIQNYHAAHNTDRGIIVDVEA